MWWFVSFFYVIICSLDTVKKESLAINFIITEIDNFYKNKCPRLYRSDVRLTGMKDGKRSGFHESKVIHKVCSRQMEATTFLGLSFPRSHY